MKMSFALFLFRIQLRAERMMLETAFLADRNSRTDQGSFQTSAVDLDVALRCEDRADLLGVFADSNGWPGPLDAPENSVWRHSTVQAHPRAALEIELAAIGDADDQHGVPADREVLAYCRRTSSRTQRRGPVNPRRPRSCRSRRCEGLCRRVRSRSLSWRSLPYRAPPRERDRPRRHAEWERSQSGRRRDCPDR